MLCTLLARLLCDPHTCNNCRKTVLVLKVIICPLAAAGLVKLLMHLQTPYAEKVPVAPLASIIEIGLKLASKAAE